MKYFKEIDIFNTFPQLNLNGKARFSTFFGAVMTTFFLILAIIIVLSESSNMMKKENPVITIKESVQINTPIYNYSEHGFIPLISFASMIDDDIIPERGIDPRLFDVNFVMLNFQYSKNETNGKISVNQSHRFLPKQKCEENFFKTIMKNSDYSEKYFQRENISDYYCFSEEQLKTPLTLHGSWEDEAMSMFGIVVYMCNNATKKEDEEKCMPRETIESYLRKGIFQISILQSLPDLNDYRQPVKKYFTQVTTKGIINHGKSIEVIVGKGTVETDDGEFEERNSVKEFYKINNYQEIVSDTEQGRVFLISFKIDKATTLYHRRYEKFREVFSRVGGTLNLILFFLQFFVRSFAKLDYQVEVVNVFHAFNKNNLDAEFKVKTDKIARPAYTTLNIFQKFKWFLSKLRFIKYSKAIYYDAEYNKISKYLDLVRLSGFLICYENIILKKKAKDAYSIKKTGKLVEYEIGSRNSIKNNGYKQKEEKSMNDPFEIAERLESEINKELSPQQVR